MADTKITRRSGLGKGLGLLGLAIALPLLFGRGPAPTTAALPPAREEPSLAFCTKADPLELTESEMQSCIRMQHLAADLHEARASTPEEQARRAAIRATHPGPKEVPLR
jgi:hypothetical protein